MAVVREAWKNRNPGNNIQAVQLIMEADALQDLELTREAIQVVTASGGLAGMVWIYSRSGVRGDPAFRKAMRDLGLEAFWRETGKWSDYCKPKGVDDFECE